jgi:hypothetical protein
MKAASTPSGDIGDVASVTGEVAGQALGCSRLCQSFFGFFGVRRQMPIPPWDGQSPHDDDRSPGLTEDGRPMTAEAAHDPEPMRMHLGVLGHHDVDAAHQANTVIRTSAQRSSRSACRCCRGHDGQPGAPARHHPAPGPVEAAHQRDPEPRGRVAAEPPGREASGSRRGNFGGRKVLGQLLLLGIGLCRMGDLQPLLSSSPRVSWPLPAAWRKVSATSSRSGVEEQGTTRLCMLSRLGCFYSRP